MADHKKTTALSGAACLYFTILIAMAAPVLAQGNCASCHLENPAAPAADHLVDWELSAHRRANVGCEKCHGGDPTTFEPLLAHRGILSSMNAASPVNRRHVPTTCGTCHAGPFAAFQKSRHFALVNRGDERVPVCTLCHGAAGSWRPSGNTLQATCSQCHGPRGVAPRAERAEAARALYETLHETREKLKSAKSAIGRISDKARAAQLESAYQQAEIPLSEAIRAGHQFVYGDMRDRLARARQRIDALQKQLAETKP
jgi:mono/diheme cytochrome c family protein